MAEGEAALAVGESRIEDCRDGPDEKDQNERRDRQREQPGAPGIGGPDAHGRRRRGHLTAFASSSALA